MPPPQSVAWLSVSSMEWYTCRRLCVKDIPPPYLAVLLEIVIVEDVLNEIWLKTAVIAPPESPKLFINATAPLNSTWVLKTKREPRLLMKFTPSVNDIKTAFMYRMCLLLAKLSVMLL